jgi:hypothetical protein
MSSDGCTSKPLPKNHMSAECSLAGPYLVRTSSFRVLNVPCVLRALRTLVATTATRKAEKVGVPYRVQAQIPSPVCRCRGLHHLPHQTFGASRKNAFGVLVFMTPIPWRLHKHSVFQFLAVCKPESEDHLRLAIVARNDDSECVGVPSGCAICSIVFY